MSADKYMLTLKMLIKAFAIIASTVLIFSGCGQSAQKQAPQPQQVQTEQQGDKVPDQLKAMEDSLEKIIMTLDGPALLSEEEAKKQQEAQKQQQTQQGQQQGKEQQGEGGSKKDGQGQEQEQGGEGGKKGEGGQQQGQEQQKKQEQPQQKDPWTENLSAVNLLNYQWNGFMPEAVKKGADKKLIDGFGTALDTLTTTIVKKDRMSTLMAASGAFSHIPDFYALYKTPASPEVKRIRHYTRNAMLSAMTANWAQAEADITNLKSSWGLYKNALEQDQQENASRLDFSIYELERVIKSRNQSLSDIKGRVAMSNIQSIEKALEEKQGKGGQKGSQQSGQQGG